MKSEILKRSFLDTKFNYVCIIKISIAIYRGIFTSLFKIEQVNRLGKSIYSIFRLQSGISNASM